MNTVDTAYPPEAALQRLRNRDRPDKDEIAVILADATDPDLLRDLNSSTLNMFQQKIIQAIALPWAENEPTANDLAWVLRYRVAPRAERSDRESNYSRQAVVLKQMPWLLSEGWVEQSTRADGELVYRLAD